MAAAGAGGAGRKKCYYELLEVDPKATYEEIRKAYRRVALVWHPDKNAHRLDEATERFKEIQAAHAVLSDDNERAWYDGHRESILGGDREVGEKLSDLFKYFSSSAFSGFDDSKTGFYTVFNAAFATVALEEKRYAEEAGGGYVSFGTSTSSHETVLAFYQFWSGYASRMTFSWVDEHNPLEAPNRYVRRAMEKENKAARAKARKERTDEIRALVDFCRKRDKRYLAAMLDARRREDEQAARMKAAVAERAKAAAAKRLLVEGDLDADVAEYHKELEQMQGYRLAEEHEKAEKDKRRLRKVEASALPVRVVRVGLDGSIVGAGVPEASEAPIHSSDESDTDDLFVCELCNKTFRTPAAMDNHEKSKKHQAAVAAHAYYLAANAPAAAEVDTHEEGALGGAGSGIDIGIGVEDGGEGSDSSVDDGEVIGSGVDKPPTTPSTTALGASPPSAHTEEEDEETDSELSDSDDLATLFSKMQASKAKASARAGAAVTAADASEESEGEEDVVCAPTATASSAIPMLVPAKNAFDSSSEDETRKGAATAKKPKKSRRAVKPPPAAPGADGVKPTAAGTATGKAGGDASKEEEEDGGGGKRGKRGKKEKVAPSIPAKDGGGGGGAKAFTIEVDKDFLSGGSKGVPLRAKLHAGAVASGMAINSLRCEVCGETFDTRNLLFTHIKKSGHAALKPAGGASASFASAAVEEEDGKPAKGSRKGRR